MHYQNLIIIHEVSKKLLKMKNSKHFFLYLLYMKGFCEMDNGSTGIVVRALNL